MKNIIRSALIARLSGIAEWKNEKEQWIVDEFGQKATIEWKALGVIIVRSYWDSGALIYQDFFLNDVRHGKCTGQRQNGQLEWEENYKDGRLHGSVKSWGPDGQLRGCLYYKEGVLSNED